MGSRRRLELLVLLTVLLLSGIVGTLVWQEKLYGTGLFVTLTSATTLLTLFARFSRPTLVVRETSSASAIDEQTVLFRTIIDQAPSPIVILKEEGQVRAVNRAARRVFNTADLIDNPPAAILERGTDRFESGERVWRMDRIDAYLEGRLVVIVILIDIETEERLATFKATKELLQLLGHEVMNALAPISSLIESAISNLSVPSRRETVLPAILGTLGRRAEGLLRITDAYRALARVPDPNIGLHTLDLVISDVVRIAATQRFEDRNLAAFVHVTHPVRMDRDLITQALGSIVLNACESSPKDLDILVEAKSDGRKVSILISNDGPSIANDAKEDIFKIFYTTKKEGSGIGLSMARNIARAHGGDVVLKSNNPVIFELWLPA